MTEEKELKPSTELLSRNYAHNLISVLAQGKMYNYSRSYQLEELIDFLKGSMDQIKAEGYDYDDLVTYKMPKEYERLITVTHKEGDWDQRLDKGIEEMENIAKTHLEKDFKKMSSGELKKIGFKIWQEDFHLIPLYLVPVFSDGDMVESVVGHSGKIRDADLDSRFGCIAYGFRVKTIIV